jgi:hypothetical protein
MVARIEWRAVRGIIWTASCETCLNRTRPIRHNVCPLGPFSTVHGEDLPWLGLGSRRLLRFGSDARKPNGLCEARAFQMPDRANSTSNLVFAGLCLTQQGAPNLIRTGRSRRVSRRRGTGPCRFATTTNHADGAIRYSYGPCPSDHGGCGSDFRLGASHASCQTVQHRARYAASEAVELARF